MKDFYEILDVSPDASQEKIKEQYRFLIQAWHPDKFSNPTQKSKAEEKTKEINEAYATLHNPAKREQYDRERSAQSSWFSEERDRQQTTRAEAQRRRAEYEKQQRARAEETERRRAEEERREKQAEAERRRTEAEHQQILQAQIRQRQQARAVTVVALVIISVAIIWKATSASIDSPPSKEFVPSSPTPNPTPSSTNVQLLNDEPSNWLPSFDNIPNELYLAESNTLSNEEIANQYGNPTEVLKQLEEWGRVSGYYQDYLHNEGCSSKTGLRLISLNTVLYKTDTGAEQALTWFLSQGNLSNNSTQPESINGIGEKAYIMGSNATDDCEPTNDLDAVTIAFRRVNALGFVGVRSVAGTVSEDEMKSIAVNLGQLIDLGMVSGTK